MKNNKSVIIGSLSLLVIVSLCGLGNNSSADSTVDDSIISSYEKMKESNNELVKSDEIIMQLTESNENLELEKEEITQCELYYKCLNTLEYLDQLSGEITINKPARFDGITKGKFEFNFNEDNFHSIITHELNTDSGIICENNEIFNKKGHCYLFYDYSDGRKSEYTEKMYGPTMEGIIWSDESNIYSTYGKDPTNAHEMGVCFIPQEMSIGYLENFDNWKITEITDWHGRECCHVQGVAEEEYGSRFDVSSFDIMIDKDTGIWYQYEGYNNQGELTDSFYTDNIMFGENAKDVTSFSNDRINDYVYFDCYK